MQTYEKYQKYTKVFFIIHLGNTKIFCNFAVKNTREDGIVCHKTYINGSH